MSSPSDVPAPSVVPELQAQAEADALLDKYRLGKELLSLPIAQLDVLDENRKLDPEHLAKLTVSMMGRIDVTRSTCQVVLSFKDGREVTIEEARNVYGALLAEHRTDTNRTRGFEWLTDVFKVSPKVYLGQGVFILAPPSGQVTSRVTSRLERRFALVSSRQLCPCELGATRGMADPPCPFVDLACRRPASRQVSQEQELRQV